jgi:hypothetical protein
MARPITALFDPRTNVKLFVNCGNYEAPDVAATLHSVAH